MDESILNTIKELIGPSADYDAFDPDLILHINTAFSVLNQLGVGPEKPFRITDNSAKWSDFLEDGRIEAVKDYVYLKVKLLFDPPSSSFVLESINKELETLEWRMNLMAEIG